MSDLRDRLDALQWQGLMAGEDVIEAVAAWLQSDEATDMGADALDVMSYRKASRGERRTTAQIVLSGISRRIAARGATS